MKHIESAQNMSVAPTLLSLTSCMRSGLPHQALEGVLIWCSKYRLTLMRPYSPLCWRSVIQEYNLKFPTRLKIFQLPKTASREKKISGITTKEQKIHKWHQVPKFRT